MYKLGSVEDHIHSLFDLSKNRALKDVVEKIKTSSSSWIKDQGAEYQNFYWQTGYAAFSVSMSMKEKVVDYIENQWKRHERVSFQDELLEFFEKYDIDYDEEHVWD